MTKFIAIPQNVKQTPSDAFTGYVPGGLHIILSLWKCFKSCCVALFQSWKRSAFKCRRINGMTVTIGYCQYPEGVL